MRSSGLRGGAGRTGGAAVACFVAELCGAVLDAIEEERDEAVDDVVPGAAEEAAPCVTGKPVVELMPGGVRGSGRGVAPCADGSTGTLRRAGGRRFTLVERNPVVPAPEPGALA